MLGLLSRRCFGTVGVLGILNCASKTHLKRLVFVVSLTSQILWCILSQVGI